MYRYSSSARNEEVATRKQSSTGDQTNASSNTITFFNPVFHSNISIDTFLQTSNDDCFSLLAYCRLLFPSYYYWRSGGTAQAFEKQPQCLVQ